MAFILGGVELSLLLAGLFEGGAAVAEGAAIGAEIAAVAGEGAAVAGEIGAVGAELLPAIEIPAAALAAEGAAVLPAAAEAAAAALPAAAEAGAAVLPEIGAAAEVAGIEGEAAVEGTGFFERVSAVGKQAGRAIAIGSAVKGGIDTAKSFGRRVGLLPGTDVHNGLYPPRGAVNNYRLNEYNYGTNLGSLPSSVNNVVAGLPNPTNDDVRYQFHEHASNNLLRMNQINRVQAVNVLNRLNTLQPEGLPHYYDQYGDIKQYQHQGHAPRRNVRNVIPQERYQPVREAPPQGEKADPDDQEERKHNPVYKELLDEEERVRRVRTEPLEDGKARSAHKSAPAMPEGRTYTPSRADIRELLRKEAARRGVPVPKGAEKTLLDKIRDLKKKHERK